VELHSSPRLRGNLSEARSACFASACDVCVTHRL
jgi:hypothetical protein